MQFTHDMINVRAVRRLKAVEGSETMVLPGMYGNKPGRVTAVTLTYVLNVKAGEWQCQSISLHGVAVKQDGTDSKNSFTQSVYTWDLERNPERWQWLRDLTEQARPTASPVFPSSFEGREFSAE